MCRPGTERPAHAVGPRAAGCDTGPDGLAMSGYLFGVTEFDRAEAAPVPAAVTAATVKV